MAHNIVFVSGVGRSGTSALTRLLNAHPDLCIGMERFKFPFLRDQQFDPALFSKDRFFQFSAEDTNILPSRPRFAQLYQTMEEKWDDAKIVGDKLPRLIFHAVEVEAAFPGCKWLFVVRQVIPVALSWDARAKNETDRGWPARSDFFAAVTAWNEANQLVLEKSRVAPQSIHTICYERLFSGDVEELRGITEFLGIDLSPEFLASHQKSVEIYHTRVATKDRSPSDEQESYARAHADMATYQQLIAQS